MEHLKEIFILATGLMILEFSCCTFMGIYVLEGVSEYEEFKEVPG